MTLAMDRATKGLRNALAIIRVENGDGMLNRQLCESVDAQQLRPEYPAPG